MYFAQYAIIVALAGSYTYQILRIYRVATNGRATIPSRAEHPVDISPPKPVGGK
jgi:hypothetical protein